MKIAVYDTEHFETTYTVLKILNTGHNTIVLFTDKKTSSILKNMLSGEDTRNIHWEIKSGSSPGFILKMYRICRREGIEILLLNTVSYHHLYFSLSCFFLNSTKSILTIHAVNNFFTPKPRFNVRSIMQWVGKKLLARSVFGYSVLLKSTRTFIEAKQLTQKAVHVIPGAFYQNIDRPISIKRSPVLVVPGSIEQYRRNYEDVFNLANEAEKKEFYLRIVLLGTAVGEFGERVLKQCRDLQLTFVTFTYYTSPFVEQEEYDSQLKNCDFIFLPLSKTCQKQDEQAEEYGVSICSGSFFDAVRFAKPILIPEYIFLPAEITHQCFSYHSIYELIDYLSGASINEKYDFLSEAALENSKNFTLEKVRADVFRQLEISETPGD
ncbi:MAG: hypothetical protein JWP69_728 [Flaviaesturariibacter sp.]|nr:hypothetical protein [Flaviaesturariibacter sp.]